MVVTDFVVYYNNVAVAFKMRVTFFKPYKEQLSTQLSFFEIYQNYVRVKLAVVQY